RVVGCTDGVATGDRPLTVGSSLPGFHVVACVPGRELALQGGHRFSTYSLTFRLETVGPDRSLLRAETRAVFPGAAGAVYRLLVIRSGGHAIVTRRILSTVRRAAERRPTPLGTN